MTNVEYFTNDSFKVLAYCYDMRNAKNVAYVTQKEMAEELAISFATINKFVGELKRDGYLAQDGNHTARYILTDKAIITVEAFRNADKK